MSTHMSPFNMMLITTMLISSLMVLSSNNLLLTWCALELNMLSFIPLMSSSQKYQETEAMLKYFLMQAIGSMLFLLSSSSMWWMDHMINQNMIMLMFIVSILIKLGMFPCHMWFPSVMTSLSLLSCSILATWQKLAPLSLLVFFSNMPMITLLLIPTSNTIIGAMMGMNQTKFKSIMAFSSIAHMGWMSSFMLINKPMYCMMYLLMYSLIIIQLFWFCYMSLTFISNKTNKSMMLTMSMIILLLSISGIPPLMGFIPKWLVIYSLINFTSVIIILLMSSLMNMYFYLNLLFSMMLSTFNNNKMVMMKDPYILLILSSSTLPILILMLLTYAMTLFNQS